jgi:hypothetical protein
MIAVIVGCGLVYAGDTSRKGSTGADQLLIPVGAKTIATAGAFMASTTGAEAVYINPAGLSGSEGSEALFSYSDYIADLKLSYFAAAYYMNDLGSVGISFKNINFGDIPVTTAQYPDGTGATYSPSFFVLGLTYSKPITDRVRAGVTMKYINESIMATNASGLAFDFGIQYKFLGNLWLGVALKNIGSDMRYTGTDLQQKTQVPNATPTSYGSGEFEPVTESFELPSMFEMSMSYLFQITQDNSLSVAALYRNNNALEDEVCVGGDLTLLNLVHVRGGYELLTQNQSESEYGSTFGAGIEYNISKFVIDVDYAYRSFKSFKGNQVLGIRVSF